MKYIHFVLILSASIFAGGCATVLTGTTQRVTIDSTPQGADIIIDGYMMGTTPAILQLNRDINAIIDGGKNINLEMDGYYSDGYFLDADIEPTTILNVLFPFGFALDAVSGAMMKYNTNYYNIPLVPVKTGQHNQTANQAGNQPADDETDDYEKLMKLAELHENGLLTDEEFEAEKAKILQKDK